MRILPGVLKELVKHVPTIMFHLVDWNELMGEIPKISRRILQKEDYDAIFDNQKDYLSKLKISLRSESLSHPGGFKELWISEKVLQLYFSQLFSPHGVFLDLRSQNFGIDAPYLLWHPTGLWIKFSPKFQEGLIHIYDGFYQNDENLYRQGLVEIGIMKEDWPAQDKDELGQIFKTQFGSSQEGAIKFNLEDFKNSMLLVANFLIKKKVTISKDFLYLGIYLVTLYSFLEESGQKLEVKNEYLKIKQALG